MNKTSRIMDIIEHELTRLCLCHNRNTPERYAYFYGIEEYVKAVFLFGYEVELNIDDYCMYTIIKITNSNEERIIEIP